MQARTPKHPRPERHKGAGERPKSVRQNVFSRVNQSLESSPFFSSRCRHQALHILILSANKFHTACHQASGICQKMVVAPVLPKIARKLFDTVARLQTSVASVLTARKSPIAMMRKCNFRELRETLSTRNCVPSQLFCQRIFQARQFSGHRV